MGTRVAAMCFCATRVPKCRLEAGREFQMSKSDPKKGDLATPKTKVVYPPTLQKVGSRNDPCKAHICKGREVDAAKNG